MTVSSSLSRVQYVGDGSTAAFAVTFPFKDAADLKVTILATDGVTETVKTLTTHYNVSGGNGGTGTVTFTGGNTPALNQKITITRNVALTQETDYVSNDPFPSNSHELALDKLTYIVQQINEQVNRCLRLPVSSATSAPGIADFGVANANKAVVMNASGNGLVYGPTTTEITNAQTYATNAAASAAAAAASASAAASGQAPWFTPTTTAPALSSVLRGLYRAATDVVGIAARSAAIMLFAASAANADNYLQLQASDTVTYGSSTHGNLKLEALGAATSIRMDFMTKYDNAANFGSSGIAFYAGPNRLIMRLEPTGVNYTGAIDRHVHIEPGYSGTGQFPSIRSMANDGYIGPGGSGTNNNVTTADINFGILSCGRGYIGFHTRGGNTDTAVGGGAGTGGGVDVLQAMVSDTAAANTFVQITGGAAGANAKIYASSSYATDIGLTIGTQNAGAISFVTDAPTYSDSGSTAREQLRIGHVGTAVSYWRFQGATTGNQVYTQPDSATETNVGVIFGSKGSGSWFFQSGAGTLPQFVILHQASSVNYLYVQGAATGNAPVIGCYPVGDTNQDITIAPRGTGKVNAPALNVTGSNAPANGLYLAGTNNPRISANGAPVASFTLGTSGGNHIRLNAAAAGGISFIGTDGADSTGSLGILNVGQNDIIFYTAFSTVQMRMVHAASAVNVPYIKAGATGAAIEFGCYPSGDTNIDVKILPRGTGRIWVGPWTSNADAAVNGYALMKDAGGTERKFATIA